MIKPFASGVAWLACGMALATGCGAPAVRYFADPTERLALMDSVADTVYVMRIGEPDSVSAEGTDIAAYLLSRADSTGRDDLAAALRPVLAVVPDSLANPSDLGGRSDRALLGRLQRGDLATQFDLLRADELVVDAVSADTVTQEILGEDEWGDPVVTTFQWLAVIWRGRTFLDRDLGRRAEIRP